MHGAVPVPPRLVSPPEQGIQTPLPVLVIPPRPVRRAGQQGAGNVRGEADAEMWLGHLVHWTAVLSPDIKSFRGGRSGPHPALPAPQPLVKVSVCTFAYFSGKRPRLTRNSPCVQVRQPAGPRAHPAGGVGVRLRLPAPGRGPVPVPSGPVRRQAQAQAGGSQEGQGGSAGQGGAQVIRTRRVYFLLVGQCDIFFQASLFFPAEEIQVPDEPGVLQSRSEGRAGVRIIY